MNAMDVVSKLLCTTATTRGRALEERECLEEMMKVRRCYDEDDEITGNRVME